MLEIQRKREQVKKMESGQLKVKEGIELALREKMLQKRIIKKFKKIKGHNKEEILPDVLAD